ncbi:hypothetical protein FI667_g5067, partial [Globisporangium splendens]
MPTAAVIDWITAGFPDLMEKGYVAAVETMNRAKKAFEEYYGSVTVEETMTSVTGARELDVSNVLPAIPSDLDDVTESTSVHQLGDGFKIEPARFDMTSELDDADLVVKTWSFSELCAVEDKDLATHLAAAAVDRSQVVEISLCENSLSMADDDFTVTELSFDECCEAPAPGRCCMQ